MARWNCWACLVVWSTVAGSLLRAEEPPSASPRPQGLVPRIHVQPDKAPDCSSLKSIVESITRDCTTNDEKAIAIYNFMQLTHYHRAYPNEPGGLPVLKEIHCYGWSLCGGLHSEQSALWRELGWGWRFVGWSGHTTVEAFYDGRWHYLDSFLKFYAWMPDPNAPGGRTIAGEDDLNRNPKELIEDAFVLDPARNCVYARESQLAYYGDTLHWQAPSFLSCGDELQGVIAGLKTHRPGGPSEGWAGIVHATGDYSTDVDLAPGFALTNTWDPIPDAWYWAGSQVAPGHTCGGHKDTRNDPGIGFILEPYVTSKPARSYANGVLSFTADLSSDAVLRSFVSTTNVKRAGRALVPEDEEKPGVVVVELASPYILTRARGEAAGADSFEVSTDGGKTFRPVDATDFSSAVRGHLAARVRIAFTEALTSLSLEAIVQNNAGALPYLSPGRNAVTVSVADPAALGDNRLVVTYAYRLGSRRKSFEEMVDEDKELAKAHDASWSDEVTCVRKSFAAGDLPATFTVDCPTPKGQHPVYPRMVFLRREVLGMGQKPLATPAPPSEPVAGPGEELATFPSPWTMGTQRPPDVPARPTRTVTVPVRNVAYVSKKGEVFQHQFVKWLKDSSDAWVLLVDFDPAAIPDAEELASARLVLHVDEAHDKAPMQAAAVMLDEAFEPGKPYDFSKLGRTVGTAIVEQGTGARYSPPRAYRVDVTRAVRAWAKGANAYGLAVRIVPNRSVDDGWTVRFTPNPEKPVELELETYAVNDR